MTETKSGGRQLKGDMAGSEEVSVEPFHSHKNVKKKAAPSLKAKPQHRVWKCSDVFRLERDRKERQEGAAEFMWK